MKQIWNIDPRLHVKKLDELLDSPKIVRVNEFTEQSLEDFDKDMTDAHNTGQPVIPIVIDSYGGEVYALLGMASIIENASLPVATICTSKAMSAGFGLFCFGTEGYRFMNPHATIMIHDVASMSWGKIEEMKAKTQNAERLNKLLFNKIAKRIGKPADYFLKLIDKHKHADWFMTATEAKKHNIVNHLRVPEMEVRINLEVKFQ